MTSGVPGEKPNGAGHGQAPGDPILGTPRLGWGEAARPPLSFVSTGSISQEAKLALLRQCLQELRTKRQEWNVPSDAWPETRGLWSERPQLPWDARQRRDLHRGDLAVPSRSS